VEVRYGNHPNTCMFMKSLEEITFPFQLAIFDELGPYIWTDHGPIDAPLERKADLLQALHEHAGVWVIAISNFHRIPDPRIAWLATIHHGIPENLLNPVLNPSQDYVAFLGRIVPEKGITTAVSIAAFAKIPLKVAAKIDVIFESYYKSDVKPLFEQHQVEFLGEINEYEKRKFLGNAVALLVPNEWDEPFGLVLIESMACGTPVIAFDRGAVREIIVDGLTGFIVHSVEEAVEKIPLVKMLDRDAVRNAFLQKFTAKKMAEEHVKAYEKYLGSCEK